MMMECRGGREVMGWSGGWLKGWRGEGVER